LLCGLGSAGAAGEPPPTSGRCSFLRNDVFLFSSVRKGVLLHPTDQAVPSAAWPRRPPAPELVFNGCRRSDGHSRSRCANCRPVTSAASAATTTNAYAIWPEGASALKHAKWVHELPKRHSSLFWPGSASIAGVRWPTRLRTSWRVAACCCLRWSLWPWTPASQGRATASAAGDSRRPGPAPDGRRTDQAVGRVHATAQRRQAGAQRRCRGAVPAAFGMASCRLGWR
jgi:hypothetical protein